MDAIGSIEHTVTVVRVVMYICTVASYVCSIQDVYLIHCVSPLVVEPDMVIFTFNCIRYICYRVTSR